MVHNANKKEYSSIGRTAIAEGAFLEVDRQSSYSAIYISYFESTTMTSETLDFRSVLLHSLLSIGTHSSKARSVTVLCYVAILRPFCFPNKLMRGYLGEYFLSKLDIFMLAPSLFNEHDKDSNLLGIVIMKCFIY